MNEHTASDSSAPAARTTVVITAHNYGRYLGQCIESVLAQTSPAAQIIVVDDASTDDSADVARRYLPRIEYDRVEFRSAQRSRNFGLAKAKTEYALFLDADDYAAPTMLEALEGALDEHPEARVAYCDKHVIGDAAAMKHLRLGPTWQAPEFSLETLRFRNFIMLTSLVRREFVDAFDERISRLQDWDLWLGILKDESHAIHVPQPLLHYRVHGENISVRQRELIERLKILVKHGLTETAASDRAETARSVVVLTLGARNADAAQWQHLAQRRGWKLRVIVGLPAGAADSITRVGSAVVQATASPDLEDLFRRYAGVITDARVDAIVAAGVADGIPDRVAAFGDAQHALRCDRALPELLAAKSLEDLGTFMLSPAAARLLLYLPPAERPTPIGRLRHAAAELVSQHIGWRFRRQAAAGRRHGH